MQGKNIVVLSLRTLTILFKTFFIFYSARLLTLEDFGKLALINSAITIMLSIMGGSFHSYSSRIIGAGPDVANPVFNHFLFVAFSGLLSFAFLPLLVMYGGIELSYVLKFSIILYCEHALTEVFRVLLSLNKVVLANAIYFLRTCCATLIPLFAILITPQKPDIHLVLNTWLYSISVLLIVIMVLGVWRLKKRTESISLETKFIKAGLKTSFLFLISSFLGRSFFSIDKFLVNEISGTEEVGVYAFFYSMAFTVQTLVETSLISTSLPEFLKSKDIRGNYRSLILKVFALSLLLSIGIVIFKDLILNFLNKKEFIGEVEILYIFLGNATIYTLALATMMPLYTKHLDREILKSYVISFIFFILISLINHSNHYSIAYNMGFSCLMLLTTLFYHYRKISSREFRQ